jgi:hypothetical protein
LAAIVAFGCQAARPKVNAVYFKSSSASNDELLRIPDHEFSEIKTVEALPISVKAALAFAFKQEHLLIANPGERFNPSDVMNSYPSRRLIFAGCTKERCLVHYEKGGFGHQYLAILFKLDDKQNAGFLWAASYLDPAHDLQQLRVLPHSAKDQLSSF